MSKHSPEYGFATNDVTSRLRQQILSGEFAAGERVKIADVAARFEVSAMPIREAMRTLEAEGLLQIIPNKGAIVRPIDAEFVANIYDIRAALESLLVERACLNMTSRIRSELLEQQGEIEMAAKRDDADSLMERNSTFHRILNAAGNNAEAERLLGLNQNIILALRKQLGFAPGRLEAIAAEHRELLDAVFRRDVTQAVALARLHVASARSDMVERIDARRAKK
ncbi:GntR family transcriptional regulator [Oceaniglobus trochenteri]|uniref:GntR family transcriptional regulator n=1 Tax=Oceaniglobus trochenteri TaxID=2763260 RepID=UPI001CFFF719|nr:GntR family transcriptional regulator [Oceaniglobus trochenteri]